MTAQPEFKVCPFCGKEPLICMWSVVCRDCNLTMESNGDNEKTLEAWNRRGDEVKK